MAIEDEATLKEAAKTPEGHLSIFLIGLCKWLIGLAAEQKPPSKIAVKGAIGYRVYGGAPHNDLISIAFRFEPTFAPVNDPMGIANNPAVAPDECAQASEALKQVEKRCCADTIIAEDDEIRGQLVEEMADLLHQARYDIDAYHKWL